MNKKFLDENLAKIFIDKINTDCKDVLKAYFNSDKNKIIIEDVIENTLSRIAFSPLFPPQVIATSHKQPTTLLSFPPYFIVQ